jgi:uncharacterized protein (TIGR00255 family)
MTGFGRDTARMGHFMVRAEVRSVNNRNLRVSCRLPERLQSIELELEKLIRSRLGRGTVTLTLTVNDLSGEVGVTIDKAVVTRYRDELIQLRDALGLTGEVTIDSLISLPGAITRNIAEGKIPKDLTRAAHEASGSALTKLIVNRENEGENIWRNILARCDAIAGMIDQTRQKVPHMVERYRRSLMERLQPIIEQAGGVLKEEDIHREVVFFADRSDITEEITRLRSHVALMKKLDGGDEPCGRRLEFIAQEMFREANTMASKAGDAELMPGLLYIKSEVEKIREQALNVE